ncbi:hypothetical protein GTP44_20830 [Duganella sp. FT50W]|uniref:Uncharacterized protein n=1 Tax=Duganella lactea TaxID=2692173 RepID=A0A6L8MQQ6_9BURK|nr:hypothetical protein [Duganella lactea]MYM84385.1 hypothetical protein [Duganella lactea]
MPQVQRSYETARDLHITFFKLFRSFRSIAQRNQDRQKKGAQVHEDAGPMVQAGREWIVRHDEGDVYYYRHFDVFDSLLDVFDELAILSLDRRLRLTDSAPSDLRHFDRTDAGRIYQNDDTFFDDSAFQAVATLTVLPSDIVGLYCFVLRDLREHVWADRDPDPLQDDINVLAEKFEVKHLWPTASCWEADEWQRTRDALREKLDVIDQVTALKDEDYHSLYDAVERFLYPPADTPHGNGILWGLDGFWPVWEWLVLTRLVTFEPFKKRLCWVENGNLSSDTDDALQSTGFQHPLSDERVLCKNSTDWSAFLKNGRVLGHPYPDAILHPAEFELESTAEKGLSWIEVLTLREGPVVMTLSGTHHFLVTTDTVPVRAYFRTTTPPSSPNVDVAKLSKTTLQFGAAQLPDFNRPEVCAMLRRLGDWETGPGAFWRYGQFESLEDAMRKHIGGLLLIDAKYKIAQDSGKAWAADHRKQAAYEDALTISCPETPAGYSVYICPGQAVTQETFASLTIRAAAAVEKFDKEFEIAWDALHEVEAHGMIFKNRWQSIEVLGETTSVSYGSGQKIRAKNELRQKIFSPNTGLLAELNQNHEARSLLGVSRFPGNNQFFFKNWPIRDLMDDVINAS